MGIPSPAGIVSNPSSLMDIFRSTPILIGDIVVDVLVSESPVYDFDITARPVEAGLDITDARIAKPVALALECIITDDIIELSLSSALSLLGGIQTWKDKKNKLFELKDSNQLIDVITPLDTYDDMSIASIQIDQNKSNSTALFFRISFKNIKLVKTAFGLVDDSAIPEAKKKKKKTKHKKGADSAADKAAEGSKEGSEGKTSSGLASLLGLGS
jgi:hypothetical protein